MKIGGFTYGKNIISCSNTAGTNARNTPYSLFFVNNLIIKWIAARLWLGVI